MFIVTEYAALIDNATVFYYMYTLKSITPVEVKVRGFFTMGYVPVNCKIAAYVDSQVRLIIFYVSVS